MSRFCRLCYKNCDVLLNMFECPNTELIPTIFICTNIQITKEDELPKEICLQCIQIITQFDLFRKHCHYIDKMLKESYGDKIVNDQDLSTSNGNKRTNDKLDKTYNYSECQIIQNAEQLESSEKFVENEEEKILVYEIDGTVKQIIGDNIYVCDICQKEFSFFFDYHDHHSSHNGFLVFKCSRCDKVFDTREKLVDHDSRHKIPCHLCYAEVLPRSMPAHLLTHTDLFKCNHCGVRSNSKASLEKHIKARHIGIKGFVCHICGKQSSCQSSMSRHMAYHSNDRPFKCKYCDFCAKSMNIVKVHMDRRHFAEKCVCEICAKIFKSQPSLLQHVKRIHSNRKYACDVCGKVFMEKYVLNKHLKRHAGQRLHECKVCKKEFFTVRKLKEHMHTHRQGCVHCPKCGKEFFYKKYYSKHVFKCTKTDSIEQTDISS